MSAWYLVQTKPRREAVAKANLERQGYPVYLPVIYLRRKPDASGSPRTGPLFPLYLFIRLDTGEDDWGPIRSTIGVNRLVRFGDMPARVPDQLINELKAREEGGVQVLPKTDYAVGDRVRITDGLFDGFEAVVHARTGRERSILLLNLIEKSLKLDIPHQSLEPVKD